MWFRYDASGYHPFVHPPMVLGHEVGREVDELEQVKNLAKVI